MPPNGSALVMLAASFPDPSFPLRMNLGDCPASEITRSPSNKVLRFAENVVVTEVPGADEERDLRAGTWKLDAMREEMREEGGKGSRKQEHGCDCTAGEYTHVRNTFKKSAKTTVVTVQVQVIECSTGCACPLCGQSSSWIDWVLAAQDRGRGKPCGDCTQH
eukprot:comp11914_c0_seq1/m.6566 comp11914_c0_seq1/g.6566  ORF comp11914_c0_seq1/g.6566 comp11914_c0_seq1/m.6566 type:complete len:162 (-) comp11914_c0_seq1:690-1175(-)